MMRLQLGKQALCTGRVLRLVPHLALQLGVPEALVFWQLAYLATNGNVSDLEPVRLSYTRLQKHFPFYSRRWLITVVGRLEDLGAITITRTGRVNRLEIVGEYKLGPMPTEAHAAAMLVFPDLACKVGLLDAVALQQIHLRHFLCDGSAWAVKSMTQWHDTVFPYLGLATVKRLFARLQKRELIYTRRCEAQGIPVNGYRVNYVRLAHVLCIPVPDDPKVGPGQPGVLYPLGGVASSSSFAQVDASNEVCADYAACSETHIACGG